MKSLSVFRRFSSLFNFQVSFLKRVRNLSRKGKYRSNEILTDYVLKICAVGLYFQGSLSVAGIF